MEIMVPLTTRPSRVFSGVPRNVLSNSAKDYAIESFKCFIVITKAFYPLYIQRVCWLVDPYIFKIF